MCLIGIALGATPDYPFVLAANRDELHARPTADAHWWTDEADILGGRDEQAGGTWLAVKRSGRLAAVTNVHVPDAEPGSHSRGALVSAFLRSSASPSGYARELESARTRYSPFNLFLYAGGEALVVDYAGRTCPLGPGIHALTNSSLPEQWPKATRMRERLGAAARSADPAQSLFALLRERAPAATDPRADLFISGAEFGTRSSTVILISADNYLELIERRFDAGASLLGESRFVIELGA